MASLRFDRGTLTFHAGSPGRDQIGERSHRPPPRPEGPWKWDARVTAWRADALEYHRLSPSPETIADSVPRWTSVHWTRDEIHKLRDHQQEAVRQWFDAGRRGVVVMPTGTGKTEVALAIMRETGVSTLIVSPVRDLMYQWHDRIRKALGYDAGIIGDNVFDVRPVSVTTYHSASIHMERFGDRFGLLIFDECHHLPGRVFADAARMSAAPCRLGLSATPERADGRHVELDTLIGPTVYRLPLSAVRGRTLAEYDVVRIPIRLSPEEQRRYDALSAQIRHFVVERREDDPDFSWQKIWSGGAADAPARRAARAFLAKQAIEDRAEEKLRVLEDLFKLHHGQRILVFTGSNAMARTVATRFLVPTLLHHCGKRERTEILAGFRDGSYPAIVANQVLDEGVDLPAAKVAVVLGGMASSKQARQRLGRILRKQGEERAVLYEVVSRDTGEEERSRKRRRNDAYAGTRHRAVR